MTEDEVVGWHYWFNGHAFKQALGVGDGQGGLACCSPRSRKESDTTERLNWTELNNDLKKDATQDFCLYVCHFSCESEVKVKLGQSRLTLCDPMDYTAHGVLQARILEWVAFPFSRESSQPRDRTQVSHIVGRFFPSWATREAQSFFLLIVKYFN